jgi:hypothetical protein
MLLAVAAAALVAFAPQTSPGGEEEDSEPAIDSTIPITYGGAGYQAAYDRAQRYEGSGPAGAYRERIFGPVMTPQMEDIYHACVIPVAGRVAPTFTLIISFAPSGEVDAVYVDRHTDQSECMARRFANLTAPRPPVPDFAEEVRIVP